MTGTVKFFRHTFGMINPDGVPVTPTSGRFFHFSALRIDGFKTVAQGQRVRYNEAPNDGRIQAIDIELLEPILEVPRPKKSEAAYAQ